MKSRWASRVVSERSKCLGLYQGALSMIKQHISRFQVTVLDVVGVEVCHAVRNIRHPDPSPSVVDFRLSPFGFRGPSEFTEIRQFCNKSDMLRFFCDVLSCVVMCCAVGEMTLFRRSRRSPPGQNSITRPKNVGSVVTTPKTSMMKSTWTW